MKESYTLYTDQLNPEYRTVFDQIELYLGTKVIDTVTQEEQLSALLDLFLSAQQAGKPVKSIVGGDLERFCRLFCSDYGWKNRGFHLLDVLKGLAWWMLVVSAIDALLLLLDLSEGESVDLLHEASTLNTSGYLMGILASVLLWQVSGFVTRQIMFRIKRVSMTVLRGIQVATLAVSFVLIFALMMWDDTNFWSCPLWVLALASGVYLALFYLIFHKQVKARKQEKIRFRDMVNAEFSKTFPAEMEKKYANANRRSIKRGKGPLSMEAFLVKEEKDCRLTEKLGILYYVTPVVIVLFVFLGTYYNDGFESLLDALIFAAILLVIEYAIMLSFWKISKKGVTERRAWISSKREELESGGPPQIEE